MYAVPENLKLVVSLLVIFSTIGSITTAYTFVDLLFLSTYPLDLLPYLFIGKTLLLMLFTFLVGQLLARGSRLISASLLMLAALSIFAARWLIDFSLDGFPFALAMWLDVVAVLTGVVAFNATNDVFDIRKMKAISPWLYGSGGVGGLLFGLSIPWFIDSLGAENLLFTTGTGFLVAAIGVAVLEPLATSAREAETSAGPMKHPLFVRSAIAFVLMMMLDTFADYVLKLEMGLNYDRDQIGAFMGPFYGITNAITVLMQLTLASFVIKRIGIVGMLSAMPIFGLIAAIGLYLYPGLWMAAAFRMGETVLRRGFDDVGRALVINPLPAKIRRITRLLWNGICAPIGTAFAGIILFAMTNHQTLALVVLGVSFIWLIMLGATMRSYRDTLAGALSVRRFSAREGSMDDDPQARNRLIELAVNSPDSEMIMLGLELIEHYKDPVPDRLLGLLDSEDSNVRMKAAEVIGIRGTPEFVAPLLGLLETEADPGTRSQALRAIAALDPSAGVPLAQRLIKDNLPENQAGAMLILQSAGDTYRLSEAQQQIRAMASSEEPARRKAAAIVLGYADGYPSDLLATLLGDVNPEVQTEALKAFVLQRNESLIKQVAALLGQRHISFVAGGALSAIGVPAIPTLYKTARSKDFRVAAAAIHTLARINATESEQALMALNDEAGVLARSDIARESARYASQFDVSRQFRNYAAQAVLDTASDVRHLRHGEAIEIDEAVCNELIARLHLAKKRLLDWYAVATDPVGVLKTSSVVLSRNQRISPADKANALEYLETLTPRRAHKQALALLETESIDESETRSDYEDGWLDWFSVATSQSKRGKNVDHLQIVTLLRKSSLFQDLPGEALLAIAEVSEQKEVARGEIIFEKNDYPSGFYVIASGFVNVVQHQEIVVVLKSTDVLGELELLDDTPRLNSAVAATDGLLLHFNRQVFEGLAEDIPQVTRNLAQRVIQLMRASLEKTEEGTKDLTTFATSTGPKDQAGGMAFITRAQLQEGKLMEMTQGQSMILALEIGDVLALALASRPYRLKIDDEIKLEDPDSKIHRVNSGENLIGRDTQSDIVVSPDQQDISRQHLVIELVDDNNIKLTNLSSAGTRFKLEEK